MLRRVEIANRKPPLVVEARRGETLGELIARFRRERERLLGEVARAGAILFRGFGVATPEALGELARASGEPMDYQGGDSPRTRVGNTVYTSTECPRQVRIPLHNELSFLGRRPRHLWFACAAPAVEGGETTLADGRLVLRELEPEVRERFLRAGIHYVYRLRGRDRLLDLINRFARVTKTWMETLETSDPREAEARARTLAPRARWQGRDLVLDLVQPAAIAHPLTGEPAWFNQAHLFLPHRRYLSPLQLFGAHLLRLYPRARSHDARFADGSALDARSLDAVFDALARHTARVAWQRGDALWIDNFACLHGREPFSGARRILVAMIR